ncbi:hypothetical protein DL767_010536 [Monosporascus sp. MG133]|nr:hypothetical protein DL767_010536 [Monosporascus sp. MG133]
MRDPDLSDAGHQRSAKLRDTLRWMDKVTHLILSPTQRALNLCLLTFEPVISRGKRTIGLPELTDAGTREASFGSSKSVLVAKFSDKVDLGSPPSAGTPRTPRASSAARRRSGAAERHSRRYDDARAAGPLPRRESEAPKFGAMATWGPLEYCSFQFAAELKDGVRLFETWESHLRKSLPTTSTLTDDERKMLREGATRRILRCTSEIEATFQAAREGSYHDACSGE